MGFDLEICDFVQPFSKHIQPDWGNIAWVDTVRFGSIGLRPMPIYANFYRISARISAKMGRF